MMSSETIDSAAFRRTMGRFATGVTVITVQQGDLVHGMTANTFTSLSLDPPLVLFCVGKSARMARLLEGAEGFAINILAADQEEISRHFAGRQREFESEIDLLQRGPVAPLVPGSLGALSCTIETRYEGGDHWIVVGRVVEIHEPVEGAVRPPLVFFGSRYATLSIAEGVQPEPDDAWGNDAILIYHDEWTMGDDPPPDELVRAHIWE